MKIILSDQEVKNVLHYVTAEQHNDESSIPCGKYVDGSDVVVTLIFDPKVGVSAEAWVNGEGYFYTDDMINHVIATSLDDEHNLDQKFSVVKVLFDSSTRLFGAQVIYEQY